jgi:hypothetical protein
MVEVFKTNIQSHFDAIILKGILFKEFPDVHISFDLEDCDKILRTEGKNIPVGRVIQLVEFHGFYCQVLE